MKSDIKNIIINCNSTMSPYKTYKCKDCGKRFVLLKGDLVCEPYWSLKKRPECPHCGSQRTRLVWFA